MQFSMFSKKKKKEADIERGEQHNNEVITERGIKDRGNEGEVETVVVI